MLPTTWHSPVPIHDATKNIITRGPFTCTTDRVHCATHPIIPFQWVMLVLLAILIYQTWTCPSLPFVKDPTICESRSWIFLFLCRVTAAVLAVPVVVAVAAGGWRWGSGISGISSGSGVGVSGGIGSGGIGSGSDSGRGVGDGGSKGGSINNSIEGGGSVAVVIADPPPDSDSDSDSDNEFFDALSDSHGVECQIEDLGSHFDHFDLDSESGQSSDEPELDDNSPDEFIEQNNVNKIIQSLIDNELPIHHRTQVQKLHPVEEDLMIVMKKHNLPIHLYKDGPHGNEWVSTILGVAESDPTGVYDRVNFFFSADIPSDVPGSHTIIHCNPDYHSYPWEGRSWHDWIMVKWTTGLRVYEQAAHLLLIAHFMDTNNNRTKDICAVNSLSGNKPKPDNLLPFFNGDTIE